MTAPLAIVRGETVLEAPKSLYIPPAALRVMLDEFEGPLDLLLFLVRKHKYDVLNIPMTPLCRQYAAYVDGIVHTDLELSADYLSMAALLIEIKTKMLLPQPEVESEDEEDPRADLVRRLLEYEQIQRVARQIADLPRRDRDFISPLVPTSLPPSNEKPALQSSQLATAFAAVQARKKSVAPYLISTKIVSVREIMSGLIRRLQAGIRYRFSALARSGEGGVTFMAVLQLAFERAIVLRQKDDDDLHIEIREDK